MFGKASKRRVELLEPCAAVRDNTCDGVVALNCSVTGREQATGSKTQTVHHSSKDPFSWYSRWLPEKPQSFQILRGLIGVCVKDALDDGDISCIHVSPWSNGARYCTPHRLYVFGISGGLGGGGGGLAELELSGSGAVASAQAFFAVAFGNLCQTVAVSFDLLHLQHCAT